MQIYYSGAKYQRKSPESIAKIESSGNFYSTLIRLISNMRTELAGIPALAVLPYARFEGMYKVPLPPLPKSRIPSRHPAITFARGNVGGVPE